VGRVAALAAQLDATLQTARQGHLLRAGLQVQGGGGDRDAGS
jgi:hypothetical protein